MNIPILVFNKLNAKSFVVKIRAHTRAHQVHLHMRMMKRAGAHLCRDFYETFFLFLSILWTKSSSRGGRGAICPSGI